MKSLIQEVSQALYTKHLTYEDFIKKFTSTIDKDLPVILVAINITTRLTEPVTSKDIEEALNIVLTSAGKNTEREEALARHNWNTKLEYLNKGKQAYKANRYSYEAAIYNCEKAKGGVSSSTERDKWRKLSSEVNQAELDYNNHLAKRKEADEADSYAKAEAAFKKIVSEVEEEKLLYGEKTKEELQLEREEIMRDFKRTLDQSKNTDHN